MVGKLFTGSSYDKSCWNCGKKGHNHYKCSVRPDPVRIAAAKAKFLENKPRHKRPEMSATKQVLFELAPNYEMFVEYRKTPIATIQQPCSSVMHPIHHQQRKNRAMKMNPRMRQLNNSSISRWMNRISREE